MTEPTRDERLTGRLAAVAALGFLLFVPPLLSQFNRVERIFGVPVLWAYLFLAWAVVIAMVAVLTARSG